MWRSGRKLVPDLGHDLAHSHSQVNPFSSTSMATLLHSIREGNIAQLQEELEAREMDVTQFINGRSTLHYAADHGQTEMLRFLVENGANVNAADEYGVTPLLTSIWEGHVECVRYLLLQGAADGGLTPDGKTYLEVADNPEIRTLLEAKISNKTSDSSEEQLTPSTNDG